MIHSFNDKGMRALDPQWAGSHPRRITTEERQLIIKTATKRPRSLGQPFTRWSVRKLALYLATKKGKKVQGLARAAAPDPRRGEDHLPAHQDLEGVTRSAARAEAGPHRVPPRARAPFYLCLRRVRTAGRQARGWVVLGPNVEATTSAGQLPQAARDQTALRLVLGGCRPPLWPHRTSKGHPPDAAGPQGHPGQRARRPDDLRDLGQLEPPPGSDDPNVVRQQRRRTGLRSHLWIVGQSDRSSLRPAARVLHCQLGSPEPCRNGQGHPCLHSLAPNAHTTDPEVLALERKHRARMRGEAQRRWGQPKARAA